MTPPTFEQQAEAWRRIPVDDVGYFSGEELLAMPDAQFDDLTWQAEKNRFLGWRNWRDRWVKLMGLDEASRSVLDFGCGLGLDSARMATRNLITLADIHPESIAVATRTLARDKQVPFSTALITGEPPFVTPSVPVDTFYASGVLHHIPHARDIVARAAELVGPGGHIRAMLYGRPAYEKHRANFVRAMDAVGNYATWYDAAKIDDEWGEFAELDYCEPITEDGSYVAAHLVVP